MKTKNTESHRVIAKMGQEPILTDGHELTSNIIAAINMEEQYPMKGKIRFITISFIQRSLAVASVIIIMIFGIEQYIVIHKVTQLEVKVSNIKKEDKNIGFGSFVNYNVAMMAPEIEKVRVDKLSRSNEKNLRGKIMLSRLGALAINQVDNRQVLTITNY